MQVNPMKSWTASFIREWLPYMRFSSVLKLRNYQLRESERSQASDRMLVLDMKRPLPGKLCLREFGSDGITFQDVFIDNVYGCLLDYMPSCQTILDLGANIGLASLYFALHHPQARIFAIEPDPQNFRLLSTNLDTLIHAGRCSVLQGAVWSKETPLILQETGSPGAYNAFTMREAAPAEAGKATVPGLSMAGILERSGFPIVDILKVDIEGAEVELLDGNLDWLARVRAIAIEFHEESRAQSDFDRKMQQAGFRIVISNRHTVLAIADRREEAGGIQRP